MDIPGVGVKTVGLQAVKFQAEHQLGQVIDFPLLSSFLQFRVVFHDLRVVGTDFRFRCRGCWFLGRGSRFLGTTFIRGLFRSSLIFRTAFVTTTFRFRLFGCGFLHHCGDRAEGHIGSQGKGITVGLGNGLSDHRIDRTGGHGLSRTGQIESVPRGHRYRIGYPSRGEGNCGFCNIQGVGSTRGYHDLKFRSADTRRAQGGFNIKG